jgi:PKD repeat protein
MIRNIYLKFLSIIFWGFIVHPSIGQYTDSEHYYNNKIYIQASANAENKDLEEIKNQILQIGLFDIRQPFAHVQSNLIKNLLVISGNTEITNETLESFRKMNHVKRVERVPKKEFFYTPNDLQPLSGNPNQWYMDSVKAKQAWDITKGSASTIIAVTENAVQINHYDLINQVYTNTGEIPNDGIDNDGNGYIDDYQGYDVAAYDGDVTPDIMSMTHGTHVSGISNAQTNNGMGVASLGFLCKLLPVKISLFSNLPTTGYEGMVYAATMGARVINCSWGGLGYSFVEQDIVDYVWGLGSIIVAAAGNGNVEDPVYPAAYNNVIAVAATSNSDGKLLSSNYGNWINISAPGAGIFSTDIDTISGNSIIAQRSGTSMATPMVSAAIALIASIGPNLDNTQIIQCLYNGAKNIYSLPVNSPYLNKLGAGRLDVYAALQCALQYIPPIANIQSNKKKVCTGETVNFNATSTGGPISNVQWYFPGGTPSSSTLPNPAVSYALAGDYNVFLKLTNNNGSDSIIWSEQIQVSTPTAQPSIQESNNILISTVGAPAYQWFLNNDTIAGAIFQNYSPSQNGTYVVCTVNSGCYTCSEGFYYNTGIENLGKNDVFIYPNPASGEIFVDTPNKSFHFSIKEINGKEILSGISSGQINIQSLAHGIYLLEIKTPNSTLSSVKNLKFIKH